MKKRTPSEHNWSVSKKRRRRKKIDVFWHQNKIVPFEIAPQAKKIGYFALEIRFL